MQELVWVFLNAGVVMVDSRADDLEPAGKHSRAISGCCMQLMC